MAQPIQPQIVPPVPPVQLAAVPNPANPPTRQDYYEAHRYHAEVLDELRKGNLNVNAHHHADAAVYKNEVEMAYLIALQLAPGALPGPLPLGMELPQIVIILQLLRQDFAQERQANQQFRQASLRFHQQVERDVAIVYNRGCGSGDTLPFREVRFVDGSLPSQAVPGRGALPAIHNVDDIRQLTSQRACTYLSNHGIAIAQIPGDGPARRQKLAIIIGCRVQV